MRYLGKNKTSILSYETNLQLFNKTIEPNVVNTQAQSSNSKDAVTTRT